MKLFIPILAACLLPLTSAATARYFIQMTGQKGDIFKSTVKGFGSASPARSINITISAAVDAATGIASGKRRYSPIVVSRDMDDYSTGVVSSLVTNEKLKTIKITVQQQAGESK
ncbi:hypothetical protein Dda_5046 [Drechslerella dactyloides]|uniref:Uncharacterized protein n=1 Tax=Drechslerella dactyloides TaxID=74499 RepID=A0AAD6NJY7_DREDA|nr:hypothetical protein Dda_5046 [Drechslerella dactyloides]